MKVSINQILFIQSLLNKEVLNNVVSSDINICLLKANLKINKALQEVSEQVKDLSEEELKEYAKKEIIDLELKKVKVSELPKSVLDTLTREQFIFLNPIFDIAEL
jgi:hypothetical protein